MAKWGRGFLEVEVYVELAKDFETKPEILLDQLENYEIQFEKMTLELIAQEPGQEWVMQRADIFGFLPSDPGSFAGIWKYLKD